MQHLASEAVPLYGAGNEPALARLPGSQGSAERSYAALLLHLNHLLSGSNGSTKSALLVWDEPGHVWTRHVDGASQSRDLANTPRVPTCVLLHAAKTCEPLLLLDAASDARFAHDESLRTVRPGPLMVVPIMRGGVARAMLLFEAAPQAEAFSIAHLHAVTAISAQLESLLDRVGDCERLENELAQQTRQIELAHSQLAAQAHRLGMAEIAANALHNVANLLTSVNTSIHLISTKLRELPSSRLSELARLLNEHVVDLKAFFSPSGKGQLIPSYLGDLANVFGAERDQIITELRRLRLSVDHMTNILTVQQSYSRAGGMAEALAVSDVVNDALRMQAASLARHEIRVTRNFNTVAPLSLDKTRMMQILINLVENATQAMDGVSGEHMINIDIRQEGNSVIISIQDTGHGIAAENLSRMFTHGFTTKTNGHGFGLHSCAIAAREMGGDLTAHSLGRGMGATFVLRLPIATH